MASLLNNASLLLNPAGSIISYQEDKIYSVLPKNGAGDFTFSGGDGGTRVNQQGYIEQTPANILSYSNTFSNGIWIQQFVTPTYSVSDPFGGQTATLLLETTDNNQHRIYYSFATAVNNVITQTIYVKSAGRNQILFGAESNTVYFIFDFTTGTISSPVGYSSYSAEFVGDGWWRLKGTWTNGGNFNCLFIQGYNGGASYVGDVTKGFYIYGGQVNLGSTAKPYQPTTDRLNYPRITYQNGRGALLSEPQRTNLALYSNTFPSVNYPSNVNGYYYYSAATLNSTNNLSPDGTNNAYNITMHNVVYDMYSTFTGLSVGTTYSYSVYVKLGSATNFAVVVNNTSAWNTVAGSQTFTNLNGTNYTRVSITFVAPSTGAVNIHLGGHAENITQQSPGDVYIWGEQFEAGTYPTSYIPTTSATVTRPLDQYSVTNLESKGLTGTNVGTLYLSVANTANSYDGGTINAKVGGGGNFPYNYMILDGITSSNRIRIFNGGAQTAAYTYTETFAKIAVTTDGTNSSVFVNGIKKGTSSGLLAGIEEITQEATGAGLRYTAATYITALSDAQCQELTTIRSGSGGNISYYGPYTIHTFTGSATFTPSFTGPVEVLVVAGGAGGGSGFNRSACGGGGGAGGLQYVSSYGVSAGTGITVTIGAGGAGGPAGTGSPTGDGSNGSNSVFGGITTIGGGGGTTYFDTNGKNGGSGGGAGGAGGYTPVGGQGIPGQGNNGGNQVGSGQSTDTTSCGGGGGAGAVGANGVTSQRGGNGGIGLPYSISGFSTYYAGGGGGGASQVGGGFGGLGGGANGGNLDSNGSSGVNYTGGGGGGASSGVGVAATAGGTGGSGIVIIRYLT